jgi:hypothetical protein
MPSSTFSSERLTAADRPGIAQPVPQRDIPDRQWVALLIAAFALASALVGSWEWHWREFGVRPATANSFGLWAMQRRRIDTGEGARTVIVGSSRMLFDIDLDTWERLSGTRPIQLALEGTSPLPVLEDLADDPNFTGRALVGVAPYVFFAGHAFRGKALDYFRHEGPGQRVGQWLSMHLIEPVFAFDDGDFALNTVLHRQQWPLRPGMQVHTNVRRLSVSDADRNTHMWDKVENDAAYQALAQSIWIEDSDPPDKEKRAEMDAVMRKQIERAARIVAKLRQRHVKVIFVRMPSRGPFLEIENRDFARETTWDVLLRETGAPGVHFADHPQMQGYEIPEWSHLAAHEKPRMTSALYEIVQGQFWRDLPNPPPAALPAAN